MTLKLCEGRGVCDNDGDGEEDNNDDDDDDDDDDERRRSPGFNFET